MARVTTFASFVATLVEVLKNIIIIKLHYLVLLLILIIILLLILIIIQINVINYYKILIYN